MRGLLLLTATLLAGCVSSGTAYPLPEDGNTAVLSLAHAETKGEPLIRFTADGRVLTRAGTAEIDDETLQDLLFYVVSTERFLDIDSQAVKLSIHQQNSHRGSALAVFNAPTTILELKLRDVSHRVEVHALEFQANAHRNIPSLQRLLGIQRRLIRESGTALIGGREELARLVTIATNELHKKHPERPGFTELDLVGVGKRRKDGAIAATPSPPPASTPP